MKWPASSELPGHNRDRGQATVELALCFPVLLVFLLGMVQLAVVVRDQLAVQLAAREAARAAAAAASSGASADRASARAVALRPIAVSTDQHAGAVTVTVTHTTHTDVPMIGALVPDITLTAAATMALEPP
jgi:Flp pilus assembly protein TadG